MDRCGAAPYEGEKGYIFISYSHKDSARVYPVVEALSAKGYRVWYDEGINPGSEWPENIADHLGRSKVCIGFISENYLLSDNCRRELNFALMKHIPFLSVMLEPVNMSAGVEMQLSANQAVFLYKQPNMEAFFRKLESTDLLRAALDAPVNTAPVCPVCGAPLQENARFCLHCMTSFEQKDPAPAAAPTHRKKRRKALIAAISVLLCAALIVGLITHFHNVKRPPLIDYDTFCAAVAITGERLVPDGVWDPSAFLDVQYDERTNTEKYTAPLYMDPARLYLYFRNGGDVITLILTDVPENRLADAKKICAAVHGAVTNHFSDVLEILTDKQTYLRTQYSTPFVEFFADMAGKTDAYNAALDAGAQISTEYIMIGGDEGDRFTIFFETAKTQGNETLYDLILRFDYKGNKEVDRVRGAE